MSMCDVAERARLTLIPWQFPVQLVAASSLCKGGYQWRGGRRMEGDGEIDRDGGLWVGNR